MPKKAKGVYATGVRELSRTVGRMDKTMRDEVVTASKALAQDAIRDITRAARAGPERTVAAKLKAYRKRIPELGYRAGAKVGVSGGATMAEYFPGTEYGGGGRRTTRQFRPYKGRTGYFFWPTVRDRGAGWASDWFHLIAEALEDDWNAGARKARF